MAMTQRPLAGFTHEEYELGGKLKLREVYDFTTTPWTVRVYDGSETLTDEYHIDRQGKRLYQDRADLAASIGVELHTEMRLIPEGGLQ